MTSTHLDSMRHAYDEHFVLDNELMLGWYPHRVIAMSQGPALLELGLGHGHSTALFARHFGRYKVIEGSSEIRNWIVTAAAADRPATIIDYQPLYRTPNGVGCAMGFAAWS